MAKNCGEWGRDKAKERYQSGGVVRKKSFDPQGESRPVNIPGLTGEGKPARLRSESTERAQIKRQNERLGTSEPASLLGHLLNPHQAGVQDAIYRGNRKKIEATGPEYARGGAAWEGSKKDVAEDKKMAKAAGMSMKTWEKSSMDKAHDRRRGK